MKTMIKKRNDNEGSKQVTPLAFTIDVKRYEHFLENSDLSEEQKCEFLETLWNIICELVSLGFGVHPLQEIESQCGKTYESVADTALLTPNMLEFEDQKFCKNFKDVAKLKTEPQGEGD